jgi:DNA (cytosine-5)-methyltransferase 1
MFEVVDLFCGAGGMSLGLKLAGMRLHLGVDRSPHCVATYALNFPEAKALQADVGSLTPRQIFRYVESKSKLVLAGCPPCQLFSQLHRSRGPVGPEIQSYLRLVEAISPRCLVFENVPLIRSYPDAWGAVIETLGRIGYHVRHKVVCASDFGVPQHRKRLILIAARTPIEIPVRTPTHPKTVRDAIGGMPEFDPSIPNHVTMRLAPQNLVRLKSTKRDGGTSKRSGSKFDDSYARMYWDRPAPTITTRCVSFSNGRFGHPEFDRAMTVREAATLQGFPRDFVFEGGVWEGASQVGNAVPPPVARAVGDKIASALSTRSSRRAELIA